MNILDWIDVGKISAERDENLKHYFYDNGTLKKIIENDKFFLLLGRKGSGKTALFNHLTENPKELVGPLDSVISVSLDAYSWNVHALLSQNVAAESLSYRQSWRFILMLETVKELSSKTDATKELKQAQKTLEKIFGSPIPSIFDLVKDKILKLSKLKLPKGGLNLEDFDLDSIEVNAGEVAFEDVSANAGLKSALVYNIEGLTKYLEDAVNPKAEYKNKIFICFDRVDEAWDTTSKDISEKVITGLITAADSITQRFNGLIRPIIFIREDIFETLPLNDKNKLREDCGSLLKWEKDGLINLILKRLNHYGKPYGIEVNDLDTLFDRNKMRQSMKPSGYILKRTMFRPRDVICFFSKIIAILKDQQSDPFDEQAPLTDKLPVDAIYQAEPQYSEWLLEEVKEEWSVQVPIIKQLFDAIQNNGSTVITKEDFRTQLTKVGLNFTTVTELNEQLKFLYNNSIIGFKIGEQNYWRYKCFYNSQGFSDEQEYHIHDGFYKSLNLSEPRNQAAM